MKRVWNNIVLPTGVHVYEGVNKTSITIIFKHDGRNRHEVLDIPVVNESTIIEAGLKYKMIMEQIKSNKFNYEMWFPKSVKLAKSSSGLKKDYTFKEFIVQYFQEVYKQGKSPTTIDGYLKILNNMAKYFGNVKLSSITQRDIKRWIKSQDGVLRKTISNRYSVLKMLIEQALDDEVIDENPLTNIPFNTIIKRMNLPRRVNRIHPFNEDERSEILEAADDSQLFVFTFWFETGLRSNEIIAIKITDINFETLTLSISRGKVYGVKDFKIDAQNNIKVKRGVIVKCPKTEAGVRDIQISNTALDVAKKQIELLQSNCKNLVNNPEGYLFVNPKTSKPWSSDKQIRTYWYSLIDKTDIERRYPYQIRHTFGSMGVKNKRDLGSIAQDMGHETLEPLINNYCKGISKKMRIKKK